MRHGLSSNRVPQHRTSGMVGIELLAGLGAAVGCGLLWAVIAYYLEREFVYAALGVGAAVGFAVAATVKEPNVGHGISAAGLSAIGLLLAKFLIIQWAISGSFVNEIVNDDDMMAEAVLYHMVNTDKTTPEVKTWYLDPDAPDPEPESELGMALAAAYFGAVQVKDTLGTDEKLVLAKDYAGFISGSMSVSDKIKAGLSLWDVLFFGLAMAVAFHIGRGGSAGEGDNDSGKVVDTPEPA